MAHAARQAAPPPARPAAAHELRDSRAGAWQGRLAVAGLVAVVAFLMRAALTGQVFYTRDLHLVWHPQVEGFVRAVAAGGWPVWDPAPAFGQPLLADGLAQVLYPITWLNLVLRPWTYYTVYAVAHLLLSAAGMRALAARLGLSRGAAFVAAVLWTAGGPFLSLVDLWHHLAGASLMPWVLLAADAALSSGRALHALRWGAVAGLQVLAGSSDMCAATALLTLVLALTRVEWRRTAAAGNLRLLRPAALAAGFALALSAGLWMPALDVVAGSDRVSLSHAVRTYWSVHPLLLLQTLLPGLWTNLPVRPEIRDLLFESREPLLASLYLGLPALALAGAALARRRTRLSVALVVIALAALLVALGRHAPFYDAIVALVPPLRLFRFPVKAMIPAAFAWALLAGIGFDSWKAAEQTDRRRWAVAVLVPLALALVATTTGAVVLGAFPDWAATRLLAPETSPSALTAPAAALAVGAVLAALALGLAVLRMLSPRWARASAAALATVAAADLLAAHRNLQPAAPRELFTHRPAVVRALAGLPHARIYAYDYTRPDALARLRRRPGPVLERAPDGWPLDAALALAMQMHLAPASAGRWDLRTGYDIDYRGLHPRDLAQLALLLRAVEGTPAHARLLRLGGVSHVVALHGEGLQDLRPLAHFDGLYPDATRLFAVPDPMPRTYAVGGGRVVDRAGAFAAIVEGQFDPAREVLLTAGAPRAAPPGFAGASRVVEDAPDRVRLEATLGAPGYVVLLDGHAPGWRARVDGRPAAVLRANVAFRAVEVPAGRHVIEYVYRPTWMLAGLSLSAAAALAGVAAGVMALRRQATAGPSRKHA